MPGAGPHPAMAAGITDHCWTVQELLSFHVPPPRWTPPKQRGRPSHALKRLIERVRSQGNNPRQTQVMELGVSRSSRIFLWS